MPPSYEVGTDMTRHLQKQPPPYAPKIGESFLQNGPCFEVAPRLTKCRECRYWSPAQKDKDIFCRFYAFRRLKNAKNRQLAIAGFCDPYKDAEEDDKTLWLSSSGGAMELDIEISCFLLQEIGDQFCDLLQQEKEAESHHLNEDKKIAWKRVVQGVREMCDVCETTLFNFHWTCGKCGFVVCLDCYKSRTSDKSSNATNETNISNPAPNGERDSFGWLICTSGGAHSARRLLLTQIATGGSLAAVASRAHAARALFGLPPCSCSEQATPSAQDTAIAQKLLQQAHRKVQNVKIEDTKDVSTNGVSTVKSENSKTSAPGWLPIKSETKEDNSDTSSSDSEDGTKLSTLREKLKRPSAEGDVQPKKKQKRNDDDITGILSSVIGSEKKDIDGDKPFSLSNLVKRYEVERGREELPVRTLTMTESKVLYPDVPHAWLCEGRLLHLTDPNNVNNYKPFQVQNVKIEDTKDVSTNGVSTVKSENSKTSAPGWLPIKSETKEDNSDTSSSDSEDGTKLSTLREKLKRPSAECDVQPKKKQKRNDDDITGILSSVIGSEKKDIDGDKPFSLSNLVKRYEVERGREELPVRTLTMTESKVLYPDVPHAWLCEGRLLHLTDPNNVNNYKPFQHHWKSGQPVIVSDLLTLLDKDLWSPASFSRDFGDNRVDLVNCASGLVVPNQPSSKFWDGFEHASKRLRDDCGAPMVLKIKDWPPGEDFAELMPARFDDLMKALPLAEYTSRNGKLNLTARLPDCFVRPDLGPKIYAAYGGAGGTTNLHLDVSDAVNVMVHASAPADAPMRAVEDMESGVDVLSQRRARALPAGALWHIYAARDADKIRDLLAQVELENGAQPRAQHDDPVHDQTWYLDAALRKRLYLEYGVEGYAILQCPGDAVFVPAGAPHQVRNLLDCIKVAEDFVSPENVSRCFDLAQQFRRLSRQHANKEDKLQIKNIVYHAVKDSVCCLENALADAKSDAKKSPIDKKALSDSK